MQTEQTKQEEKVLLKATLCYLTKGNMVLLAKKTRGICEGRLNGYGGAPEGDESLEEACVREVFEESGAIVDPKNLVKVAIIYFHNTKTDGRTFICEVHVYTATKWSGTPRDGDGMANPIWYLRFMMPWTLMTCGDIYFLPPILSGRKIIVHIHYGPFQRELSGPIEIREVPSFSEDD